MRLLTLSQWYVPEPDIKIHLLASDLAKKGHDVTSITGFPNYPGGEIYDGYHIRWRQWEEMDGVRVLRLPLYPNHSQSGLKRVANYLSFAGSASALGSALCGPADVMWVYHPPLTVGIPAWWIGLLRRIPFIYEVCDMWPETLAATGMMSNRSMMKAVSRLAAFIYRRAAAITVVSPGFKRNLVQKGVPAGKIHVIPNWADEEIYRPVERDESLAAEHGMTGRFNVVYGGNMGAAQAMDNVLKAAILLEDVPEIQFVLIGGGIDAARLEETVRDRGISNVRFIEQQPAKAMPSFYALADALLVHLRRDPLFEITIPSKTISYLACGRPIITTVPGDATRVVLDAGAGLVCEPEDPKALARTVRQLYEMPEQKRDMFGKSGRQAFSIGYTRRILVSRYEKLFLELAKKGKRGRVVKNNTSDVCR